MARSRTRKTHACGALALAAFIAPLSGCDTDPPMTVWETKLAYADSIVSGREVGTAWTISAESFDERTGALVGVRLDDGYGRFFAAERAEIVVDPASDTVALRLVDVIEAAAAATDDPEAFGGLREHAEIVTSPVRMPFDVTP